MNYVKLNDNDNHLSLGNLFNIIKKISKNKTSAIQQELFCTLFNIESISNTTINNYCTGCRSINSEYKQIYINYKKKYLKDNSIMLSIINNLLSIIDGTIHTYSILDINTSISLKSLCHNLHTLVKNDIYIPHVFKENIFTILNKEDYYTCLNELLFYIILEKKQPIYEEELITYTINDILKNTNLSINDLQKYLTIEFTEGISYIPSLKKLARDNNPYAMHKLGIFYYNKENYEDAYNYFKEASSLNHPTSSWMISHMILNKKIGSLSKEDINLAWDYLKKAISLGSISALNTIGICYHKGINPNKEKNKDLAIKYFNQAKEKNYLYAYNNLGLIYEEEKNYKEAYNCFLHSSIYEENWACNKLGEYHRRGIYVKKDLSLAYNYYLLSYNSASPNKTEWSTYNLVKYFYLEGNSEVGIKKDLDKSINLLESINLDEAKELLLYAYYEKYLETKKDIHLDKTKYYLNIINNSCNTIKKKEIEAHLKEISNYKIKLF